MGGGNSALRKNSTAIVQRQPTETQTSYRIRVKFQQEKFSKSAQHAELTQLFPSEPVSVGKVIETFHEKLHTNLSVGLLKSYYGMQETDLSLKQIGHIFADVSYNPSIGAIYAALLKDREAMNEQVWAEFLLDFQGIPEQMLEQVSAEAMAFSNLETIPKTATQFSEFLLGRGNAAYHPGLSALQQFDRPIPEYFVSVGKLPGLDDHSDPGEAVKRLASTIHNGARAIELECSGGASDGEPRVFADVYPEGTATDELPTFLSALQAVHSAWTAEYAPGNERNTTCASTGETLSSLPILLILTVAPGCGEAEQKKLCDHLRAVFGDKIDCPDPNPDGSIWSPLQLQGKVLLVAPTHVQQLDEELTTQPEPLSVPFLAMMHMRMVSVYEIRPILDQAKSRTELRRLLQNVVLTLSPTELCAHIIELSSITDMLLVHVQTCKRKVVRVKQGNLLLKGGGADYDGSVDQDTRHIVQFSELRPGESGGTVVRVAADELIEEKTEEVEPLRGWRYGAQMVPVNHFSHQESSLQNLSLFKQQNGNGFVTRLPRSSFESFPGFVDLYKNFPCDYARSLHVTILSACRIPRDFSVTQPFIRIYCNNGTGLKQVAITSTVEDNGHNCVWEEDFEFKFHINDLSAAACMLFVANDRDKAQNAELAFAFVPLWGLQTGYRSLQMYDMLGKEVRSSVLFAHFDWEPED